MQFNGCAVHVIQSRIDTAERRIPPSPGLAIVLFAREIRPGAPQ